MMAPAWGVLIAATEGASFGEGIDPVFLTLSSRPVLTYSLSAFERCPEIEGIILVAAKERVDSVRSIIQLFGCAKARKVIPLASSVTATWASVMSVLADEKVSVVTAHDAARPLVTPGQISETIQVARKQGAAFLATAHAEALLRTERSSKATEAIGSGNLWSVASPRSYKLEILRKALAAAQKKRATLASEAAALELVKTLPYVVPVDRPVLRIQSPSDLMLVESVMRR